MRRYSALMALLLGLGVVSMQGDGSADEGPSQAQRTEECSGCTCVQGPIEDVYDQETGEYLYTIFYADDHQDCTCSNPQASYFTSSTPEGSPGWPETCTYEEGATSCSCTPSHVAHSRTPPDPFPGRREKVSNEQHYEPRFPPHWNKSENRREVDPAPAFGRPVHRMTVRFKAPGDVTQKAAVVLIYIYRPQVLGPNFSDRLTRVIAIGYELARRPNENDIEVPDNLVTLPYERQGTPDRDEHAVRINLGGLSCLVLLARRS